MAPIRKRNFATNPREAAPAEYKGAHERIDYDPDIKSKIFDGRTGTRRRPDGERQHQANRKIDDGKSARPNHLYLH
jgi:hypothetical protein